MSDELINDVVAIDRPSVDEVWRAVAPLRAYFRPRVLGIENIKADKPSLLTGNHTIYGLLDPPLIAAYLYKEKGAFVRPLADRIHFEIPGWRDMMKAGGTVEGTRENCSALMEAGEHIMVFPGGGREVAKRKGEAYKLVWKNRTGFAYMAIQHGYPITPFASLGPDDAFDILIDGDEIMNSPVGRFLKRSGIAEKYLRDGEMLMPIARGLGLTMLPRPERFYFGFGRPISTKKYKGMEDDEDVRLELRERVAKAINRELDKLREFRATEDKNGILPRLVSFRRRYDFT